MAESRKPEYADKLLARLKEKARQAGGSLEEYLGDLEAPESDLFLNELLEMMRFRCRLALLQSSEKPHLRQMIQKKLEAERRGPYNTDFSLVVDYDPPIGQVASEANITLDSSCIPVLLQNAGKPSGKAKVNFSVLDLCGGLRPDSPQFQQYVEKERLQTAVGPHDLIAVYKKHPRIIKPADTDLGDFCESKRRGLFSMGNGYEMRADEEDGVIEFGLILDDWETEDGKEGKLRIGKVGKLGKLLTIRSRRAYDDSKK